MFLSLYCPMNRVKFHTNPNPEERDLRQMSTAVHQKNQVPPSQADNNKKVR